MTDQKKTPAKKAPAKKKQAAAKKPVKQVRALLPSGAEYIPNGIYNVEQAKVIVELCSIGMKPREAACSAGIPSSSWGMIRARYKEALELVEFGDEDELTDPQKAALAIMEEIRRSYSIGLTDLYASAVRACRTQSKPSEILRLIEKIEANSAAIGGGGQDEEESGGGTEGILAIPVIQAGASAEDFFQTMAEHQSRLQRQAAEKVEALDREMDEDGDD